MDKTTEIILEIENAERISFEQSFKIVSYCTQLLSQHSAEAELSARKIVIHVLNNWGKIDKNLYVVWADLIETLGFYPYIQNSLRTFSKNYFIKLLNLQERQAELHFQLS